MRRYVLGVAGLSVVLFSFIFTAYQKRDAHRENLINSHVKPSGSAFNSFSHHLYQQAGLSDSGLKYQVFEKALTGYYNLKQAGKTGDQPLLTIADFDQPSTRKRLYIIDLEKDSVILNTWVAHGQRSGEDEAIRFSNQNDSFSSSLGFYVTGEEYVGTHGRSLRLDGMDQGFNDNARMRAIVIHGADYVSEGTIEALGRLGRSQGCPAVAAALANQVISTLGSGAVLFINKSNEGYHSGYLNEASAASFAETALASDYSYQSLAGQGFN